ncbi:MAG: glycoside hydrolase family 3 C-terminal domain-containing protein [Propionibacteriaceae bacterium]|jgi:beta-glucosidase|nr:glycoside hydrolase family 3 C-terminal domain-containing protein [Propionibacteriaceae bacterium]
MVDQAERDRRVVNLSVEDKARLLTGKTAWRTYAQPALGLRELVMSDGPVGVRGTGESSDERSACLPNPSAMAACWDPELARRIGEWFARQARAHGVDIVLAPVVNLQRTPVGGRHFEALSEDPLLTADLAEAWIEGLQALGVAACIKHFVGNEVETERTSYISRIDERTLREVYLAPFERAVKAGVWSVMASYNRVDYAGEDSWMVAHHQLLQGLLKDEWGFAGPVISDWTAVRDTLPPALGGLDLVMPGPVSPWSDGRLAQAVTAGQVAEEMLDDKVKRLLWLADRVGGTDEATIASSAGTATGGSFAAGPVLAEAGLTGAAAEVTATSGPMLAVAHDPAVPNPQTIATNHELADTPGVLSDTPAALADPAGAAATELTDEELPAYLAAAATVVLANRHDALPLAEPAAIRQIALIGPNAADTRLLGGGSASVNLASSTSLADGLAQAFPKATIALSQGVSARLNPPRLDTALLVGSGDDPAGMVIELLDQNGAVLAQMTGQSLEAELDSDSLAGATTVHLTARVHLSEPGEHWLGIGTVGRHRVLVDGQLAGSSDKVVGGEVLINSSFNVPPAIGSTVSIARPTTVTIEAWLQVIETQWGLMVRAVPFHRRPGPTEDQSIAQAARLAADADLAIVVVGATEETESEGWDRSNLDLPGRQNDLVAAVLAARPDAIIWINAGSPVVLPWLERAATVLWGWFPGQDGGLALADILTGRVEPAGQLPWTLPADYADVPVPTGKPDAAGIVDYAEGLNVGYRSWVALDRQPARPFGFGLGWTDWQVKSAYWAAQTNDPTSELAGWLTIGVTNTGRRAGSTVIQAYLRPPAEGPLERPAVWLAGYTRLSAQPGQTVTGHIRLSRRVFEAWQAGDADGQGQWVSPAGVYTLTVGRHLLDQAQCLSIEGPPSSVPQ